MREALVKTEEFKDSPLGKIPQRWEVVRLGEIADLITSGSRGWATYYSDEGALFLRVGNLTREHLNLRLNDIVHVCPPVSSEGARAKVQAGDLLISITADLGMIGVIPKNVGEAYVNQHIALVRLNQSQANPRWVGNYLAGAIGQKKFYQLNDAGAKAGLNLPTVAALLVALPPKKEQDCIAEILDTVDEAIAHTSSLIAKLKQMKAGLLHDLLTRGLDENGELRDAIAHPEQFKDSLLGQIPKEWEVVQLESLAELITSGSRGWAAYYSDQGAIFIRIGNLTREHLNFRLGDIVYVNPPSSSEGSRARLQAGDILISITADLGIIGVVPENFGEAYVNQHIALVRLDQSKANSWWVGNYLSGEVGQKKFYQLNDVGAKAGLNLPTIGALLVALPPMQEQEKIAAIIKNYDTRIRAEEAYRDKLKLQKQGLMHDLLTGKVRVKNA
jgi:type I restriction enzyme S subunit